MNAYELFSRDVGQVFASSNVLSFLVFIIVLGIIYWIAITIRKKWLTSKERLHSQHKSQLNFLQKQAIHSLIIEFKGNELIAHGIPANVLELYAEYILKNLNRLKNDKSAKKTGPIAESIKSDVKKIELEFASDRGHFIFEREILNLNDKAMIIHNIDSSDIEIKKGGTVNVTYHVNEVLITGNSVILDIISNQDLELSLPKDLRLIGQRRHSRYSVKNVKGQLIPTLAEEPGVIYMDLIDISMEGARIHTYTPLKKNQVYYLNFTDESLKEPFSFKKFECIVSRSFLTEGGGFAYGLSFVYVDIETREQIKKYLEALKDKESIAN
jgi:hypothetical protein